MSGRLWVRAALAAVLGVTLSAYPAMAGDPESDLQQEKADEIRKESQERLELLLRMWNQRAGSGRPDHDATRGSLSGGKSGHAVGPRLHEGDF